jgi:hypothetical protein
LKTWKYASLERTIAGRREKQRHGLIYVKDKSVALQEPGNNYSLADFSLVVFS